MAPKNDLRRNLEELRQGERPDEHGFSSIRIKTFLDEKGITADRLKDDFDAALLKEMLESFRTKGTITAGEDRFLKTMEAVGRRIGEERLLDMLKKGPLPKSSFRGYMASNLEHALLADARLMRDVEFLHEGYVTIYDLTARHFEAGKGLDEFRETMRIETGESLEKGFAKVHENIRGNIAKMTGKEKAVAALGILVFGIYLSKSQNEKLKVFKDYLWTGAKLIGGIYVADVVMKALFGQRGFEMIQNWAQSSTANTEWFQKLLGLQNTPSGKEKAQNAQMALIAVGDRPMEEVLRTYEASKKSKIYGVVFDGVNELQFPPDKLYAGLDALFSRFKPEELRARYGAEKPSLATAIANRMAEDDLVELEPSLPQKMVSGTVRGAKWVGEQVGAGAMWVVGMSKKGIDAARQAASERWGDAARTKEELTAMLPGRLLDNAEVIALNSTTVVIAGVPLSCPNDQRKAGPPVTYRIENKEFSRANSRELYDVIFKKVDDLVKAKGVSGYTLRWNSMKQQWTLDNYSLVPAMPRIGFVTPEKRDVYLQIEPRMKGATLEAVLLFKPTVDIEDGGTDTLADLQDMVSEDLLRERIAKSLPAFHGEHIVFDAKLGVMEATGKVSGTVADVAFELVYNTAISAYEFPASFDVAQFSERLYAAKRENLPVRIEEKLAKLRDLMDDVPEQWFDHWPRHITAHFTHLFGGSISENRWKLAGLDKKDELSAWYQTALEASFTGVTPRTHATLGTFEQDHMEKFEEKVDALIKTLEKHIDEKRPASHTLFEAWLHDLEGLMYSDAFRERFTNFKEHLSRHYLIEEESTRAHLVLRYREKVVTEANKPSNLGPTGQFTVPFRNYLSFVENEIFTLLEASPDVPITARYIGQNDNKLKGMLSFSDWMRRTPTLPEKQSESIRFLRRELDLVFSDLERVGDEAIEDDVFKSSVDEIEWRAALSFQRDAIEPGIERDVNGAANVTDVDTQVTQWLGTIEALRTKLLDDLRAQTVRGKIDRPRFERWLDQSIDLHHLYGPRYFGPEYTKAIRNFRDTLFQGHQFGLFPKEYFALGRMNYQPAVAYAVLRMYVVQTKKAGNVLDAATTSPADKDKAERYLAYVTAEYEDILRGAKDTDFPGFLNKLKHLPSYLSESTLHSEQVTNEFLKTFRADFDAIPEYNDVQWEEDEKIRAELANFDEKLSEIPDKLAFIDIPWSATDKTFRDALAELLADAAVQGDKHLRKSIVQEFNKQIWPEVDTLIGQQLHAYEAILVGTHGSPSSAKRKELTEAFENGLQSLYETARKIVEGQKKARAAEKAKK